MPDDFFKGVDQLEASIAGVEARTPVFYRDARSFTTIYPASLMGVRALLPDPRFVPAQVLPGVAAVHLTAFEYYDTDIQPYNEFAIGILLNSNQFLQIPAYNMLRQLFQNTFYTYIHHLPVNTRVALEGGIELYNYPKTMNRIDFSDEDDWVICELGEGEDLILRVKGKKLPAGRSDVMKYICHLYQYQQPQYAEFKVNARQYALAPGFGNGELVLGRSHPFALELQRLLYSTTPLMYIYVPSMQAILYGPEHLSLASITFFLEKGLGVDVGELKALLAGKGPAEKSASRKSPAKKSSARKSSAPKRSKKE